MASARDAKEPRPAPRPAERAPDVASKLAAQFRQGEPTFVRVDRDGDGHFAVVRNPKLPPL